MTVGELIELLQEQDPTSLVRIATQPNYPIAVEVGNIVEEAEANGDSVVWIAEGSHSMDPYAVPNGVFNGGW